jgi:hypothetical protein
VLRLKFLRSSIAGGLLLCCSNLLFSQNRVPSTPEQVGASFVEALKDRNVAMLLEMVTKAGITLGTDGPTIPAAAFKKELQQKRGVYCILMDGACIKGVDKNAADDSLRELIIRQPVKLDVHSVEGAPTVVEVVVRKEVSSREVLFSLFLKKDHGSWKLESIEYN